MDKSTRFPTSLSGYEIEGLIGIDASRLVPLYQGCSDYVVLERGEPPNAATAKEEFESFPPNRTEADKFIFGVKAIDGSRAPPNWITWKRWSHRVDAARQRMIAIEVPPA